MHNKFHHKYYNIHLSQASLRILAQSTKLVANILGKDYESLDKITIMKKRIEISFNKNLHDSPEWFAYRSATKSNLSITIQLC
jgi:hypothetical protein